MEKLIKIGHRGFRVGVDENTADAFDKAVELDMNYIECDVRMSKDDIMVIIHDATVDRTFEGTGSVNDMTLNELKSLKAVKTGATILTAEEVIEQYSDKIKLMLEVKDPKVPKPLADLIRTKQKKDRVVFSGRDPAQFKEIQKMIPDAVFCHNITKSKSFSEKDLYKCETLEELPVEYDMISLSLQRISRKFINKCRELGIKSLCWNFLKSRRPLKRTYKIMERGVDGILFDHPKIAEEFIGSS